jgi:hypothetical protein
MAAQYAGNVSAAGLSRAQEQLLAQQRHLQCVQQDLEDNKCLVQVR